MSDTSPFKSSAQAARAVEDRTQEMQAVLRKQGVRMTKQRAKLVELLSQAEDHPDANELHARAREAGAGVSLATVYRTLSLLEEGGVIHRHAFEGGGSRFEAADMPHHDHIIDLDTGDVVEFHSEKIEHLQAQIAAELGYDVVHHRLELYCRKAGSDKS
ncbi:MAG: Fur family transcriptional regulator [Pseudomonadota bacterium]